MVLCSVVFSQRGCRPPVPSVGSTITSVSAVTSVAFGAYVSLPLSTRPPPSVTCCFHRRVIAVINTPVASVAAIVHPPPTSAVLVVVW